eukprot:scaffold7613_cov258-Pinguiococcus_pyrenoidosus.AAC.4
MTMLFGAACPVSCAALATDEIGVGGRMPWPTTPFATEPVIPSARSEMFCRTAKSPGASGECRYKGPVGDEVRPICSTAKRYFISAMLRLRKAPLGWMGSRQAPGPPWRPAPAGAS